MPSRYATALVSAWLIPLLGALALPLGIGVLEPDLPAIVAMALEMPAGAILAAPGMPLNVLHPAVIAQLIFSLGVMLRIVWDWLMGEAGLLQAALRRLRPYPPGMVMGTGLSRHRFPTVAAGLILVNLAVFLLANEETVKGGAFRPFVNLPARLAINTFFSAFLHGDAGHLAGNMIFLWIFGSALEPRIGHLRLLAAYPVCILLSKGAVVAGLLLQRDMLGSGELALSFSSIGASGAVSGLVGLFMVRCFFARIAVGLPFLFLPMVSVPVRLPAVLMAGLFFGLDVSGSVWQLCGLAPQVNYWAHVGGYFGGMLLGYLLRLHRGAAREALVVQADRAVARGLSPVAICREILAHDGGDEETLRRMLERLDREGSPQAGECYARLMGMLSSREIRRAADLAAAHFPRHLNALSPALLLRLGLHFHQGIDLPRARLCFELAAAGDGPTRPKALLMLGRTHHGLGNWSAARSCFGRLAGEYPGSAFAREAQRLGGAG